MLKCNCWQMQKQSEQAAGICQSFLSLDATLKKTTF